MKLKRFLSALAMTITTALTIHGQQLQASLSHFSTDDGLSSNAIAGISQDDYGYLWIATWNGLSRFDGYNFYNYRTGNGSGIKNLHNRILYITIDQSQNVWLEMYDGRVFVMDRATDRIINPFEGNPGYEEFRTSSPILVTSTGDVLVTIEGAGLYIMRLDRRGLKSELATTGGLTVTSMAEGYQSDIWLGTNKGIHRLDRSNLSIEKKAILPDEYISCLQSNGFNIFAATQQGSIYTFAYGKEPQLIRKASGMPIFSMFIDSHGLVWFCDDRMGASRLNLETGSERFYEQTVLVPEFDGRGGSFRETFGVVWVRMNHGGYGYYNRETDEVVYFHNDPSNPWNLPNTVNASLELPEGVVWLSTTRRGLEKLEILRNNIVRRLPVPQATTSLENEIRAIYYDHQHRLLLMGNKSNTLFIYDADSTLTTLHHDDQGHDLGRIYGITKDSKGNYWLCSKDYGLFRMSPRQGQGWSIKRYAHDPSDKYSLSSDNAYIAIEDKQGNIWVATYGGGVNLLTHRNGREVFIHRDNDMDKYPYNACMKVRSLELDKYGNVWVGTTDGILICSYKGGKVNMERLQPPADKDAMLMCSDVVCLKRDKEGNMWVGTMGGGLSRTTGQDDEGHWLFETYDAQTGGLPSDEIRCITFDEHGSAWFGTEHVICSFDPEKKIFTTFSSLDGVDETIISEGSSAAMALDGDRILFGTLNGYYIVDRRKLMTSTGSLLKLRITDFLLDGEIQSPRLNDNFDIYPAESKEITLPTHNSEFGFRFASLNYQLQHRVHYQYMLEGYDDDWQNAGKNRTATYSRLSGGTYKFKVKAFLLESPDKFDMRTVTVVVPAHPLLSTAAFWGYALLLLVAAAVVSFRNRAKLRLLFARRQTDSSVINEEITTDDYEVIDDTEK